MTKLLLINILVVLLNICYVLCVCPNETLLVPCRCRLSVYERVIRGYDILCVNVTQELDVKQLFDNLDKNVTENERHFYGFYLDNSNVHELKAQTFKNFTFDKIFIINLENLTTVDKNVFKGTNSVTKRLDFIDNKNLRNASQVLPKIINRFSNIHEIYLFNNNMTEIASNAFKPVNDYNNSVINFWILDNSIQTIGQNPFKYFSRISDLRLINTSITHIPENTFNFDNTSNRRLDLKIEHNKLLNISSFAINSLTKFKRPVVMRFYANSKNSTFIDDKVFQPFLQSHPSNALLYYDSINCEDCRSAWIRNVSRVEFFTIRPPSTPICTNGNRWADPKNFENCS